MRHGSTTRSPPAVKVSLIVRPTFHPARRQNNLPASPPQPCVGRGATRFVCPGVSPGCDIVHEPASSAIHQQAVCSYFQTSCVAMRDYFRLPTKRAEHHHAGHADACPTGERFHPHSTPLEEGGIDRTSQCVRPFRVRRKRSVWVKRDVRIEYSDHSVCGLYHPVLQVIPTCGAFIFLHIAENLVSL